MNSISVKQAMSKTWKDRPEKYGKRKQTKEKRFVKTKGREKENLKKEYEV